MQTIQQGTAEIRFTHPDAFREWVRQHKRREMVEKLLWWGERTSCGFCVMRSTPPVSSSVARRCKPPAEG